MEAYSPEYLVPTLKLNTGKVLRWFGQQYHGILLVPPVGNTHIAVFCQGCINRTIATVRTCHESSPVSKSSASA
jgi:hypothetical protein